MPLHPTVEEVERPQQALGLEAYVEALAGSTRTAAEAAAACGCDLGQIVKSLVFVDEATRQPVMRLRAGDRQAPSGEPGVRRASADDMRAATGFAVGGVPPLGHDRVQRTIVVESLDRFEHVWCAASTPHAVFEVRVHDLRRAPANVPTV